MLRLLIAFTLLTLFSGFVFANDADDKQEALWDLIEKTEYTKHTLPELKSSFSILNALRSLAPSELRRTFENKGDTQDTAGIKTRFIHRFGAVAQVKWVAEGNLEGLTGVYANGGAGLIRFSTAAGDTTPGFGLKIFRDGDLQSLNTLAMPGLNGLKEGTNFFSEPYRTTVKPPKFFSAPTLLQLPFMLAVRTPSIVNVSHFSEVELLSSTPEDLRVPKELVFVPTEEARKAFKDNIDFRLALGELSEMTLFEIYAVYDAKEVTTAAGEKIGELRTTSRFIASTFGDSLQFRHHRESLKEAFPKAPASQKRSD